MAIMYQVEEESQKIHLQIPTTSDLLPDIGIYDFVLTAQSGDRSAIDAVTGTGTRHDPDCFELLPSAHSLGSLCGVFLFDTKRSSRQLEQRTIEVLGHK